MIDALHFFLKQTRLSFFPSILLCIMFNR